MTDKLTIGEAAESLGVSCRTVHRWIARGLLETTRDGDGPKSPHKIDAGDLANFTPPKSSGRPRKKQEEKPGEPA